MSAIEVSVSSLEDQVDGRKETAVGTLEYKAFQRKERLNSLKRKMNNKPQPVSEEGDESKSKKLPRPKFRCYRPQDEILRESIIPDASHPDIEEAVQEQLAAATAADTLSIEDLDLSNLAPRKPDWDLKRDCTRKFERLDQYTKKAIGELIRDRLKESMEPTEGSVG